MSKPHVFTANFLPRAHTPFGWPTSLWTEFVIFLFYKPDPKVTIIHSIFSLFSSLGWKNTPYNKVSCSDWNMALQSRLWECARTSPRSRQPLRVHVQASTRQRMKARLLGQGTAWLMPWTLASKCFQSLSTRDWLWNEPRTSVSVHSFVKWCWGKQQVTGRIRCVDLREELGMGTGTEWVFTLTIRLHCFLAFPESPGSEQWRPSVHRALLAYLAPLVTSLNCGRLCPRSSPRCLLLCPGRGRKTPACTLPGATAPALLTEQAEHQLSHLPPSRHRGSPCPHSKSYWPVSFGLTSVKRGTQRATRVEKVLWKPRSSQQLQALVLLLL